MKADAKPVFSKLTALLLVVVMAALGVVIYLRSFAGSGNTITAAGCAQIGGQLDELKTSCSKTGVVFAVVDQVQ